jgi:hypothetical protein
MVISDLVTDKEVNFNSINAENWCICIDDALTKDTYIKTMKEVGFTSIEILGEKYYLEIE